MPRYDFTGLPTSLLYSMRAPSREQAEERSARLADETHSPASLAEQGVRIEEITFGDAADTEPVPTPDADLSSSTLVEITLPDGGTARWALPGEDPRIDEVERLLGPPDTLVL